MSRRDGQEGRRRTQERRRPCEQREQEEVRNVTADTSRVPSHRNDLSSDDEGTKRQREIFKGCNSVDSEAERSASGEDDLSDFPSQEAVDSQPEEGNFFHIAAMASSPESTLSYGIRATTPSPRQAHPPPQLVQLSLGHFPHSNAPGCNQVAHRSIGSGHGRTALTEVAAPVEWVHTALSNRHIDAAALPGQIPDAQAIPSAPWRVTVQRERSDVEGQGFLPDLPASERSEHSTDSGELHDEGDQESDGASAPSQVTKTSFHLGSACTPFASPLHRQLFSNMTSAQLPPHAMEQPLSPFVAIAATAGVSKPGEPCGVVQNPSTSSSNALGSMLATLSLGTAVYSHVPMALSFSHLPANRNLSPSSGTAAQQQSQPPVSMLTPYSQAGVPFSPRSRVSDSVSKNVCAAMPTTLTTMTVSATAGASSVLGKEWTGAIRCVPDSCIPPTTAPSASLAPAPGAAGLFPVPLDTGYFPPRFSAPRFAPPPPFLPENSLHRAPRPPNKMARISRKPRRMEGVPTERQEHGTEPVSRRPPSAYESNRDPPGRNSIPVCGGDVSSLCVPSDPAHRKAGDCFTGRSEILPDSTPAFFGQQSQPPEAEARLSAIPAMLSACGTCGCHRGCGTVVSRVTVPPPSPHSSAAFSYAGYYSAALAVAPRAPPPPPPPFPFVAVTAAAPTASSGAQYPLTLGTQPAFFQTPQYGTHRFPYYASPQVQPSPGGTGFVTSTLPDMGETRTEFEMPGGSLGIGPGPTQPKPKLSCYNCGNSGHQATDCLQPCMDSNQPGMFRIRVISYSDSGDVAE
uniref:CCHC-type domain-containing protein n=1 Tax=Eptatretus burgeri TaxID=7764 RepID=A0A8C4PXG0_EPTBU